MSVSEKPQYTKVEIILEAICLLALLIFFTFTYYTWSNVPEKIPDHFSFSGVPNSWGSKGMLPVMVYVSLSMYILFSIISRFPRIINFPIKIDEEDSRSQIQLRFSFILWIKAELVLCTSYMGIQGIRIALGESEGLGSCLGPILLIVLFGTGAIFIYRAHKLKSVTQ